MSEYAGLELKLTENQLKVMTNHGYLRGNTPEVWLRGVAHNIALAEILYLPEVDKNKIFEGVNHKEVDGLTLFHPGLETYSKRSVNFKKYLQNLEKLAVEDERAKKLVAQHEERFYTLLSNFYFSPNSPTLMNAGRDLQQLSGCFVLPVPDSIEGWGQAISYTMIIHKSGGGTGFSFSRVRPVGDKVSSTTGVASGPLSPMGIIDKATSEVKQGGTRRGANMGILNVDHPDIRTFITAKLKDRTLSNFNISVGLTNDFMTALQQGTNYKIINPKDNSVVREESAKDIFNLIVESAYTSAEPGIIFLDKINADNPTPALGKIESTNPCGEQPLLPYESCNLGSIVLSKFVKDGKMDYDLLKECVYSSVRFLDDVIDVNNFPLAEIEQMTKGNRKVGLGVMGWAETLIQLGMSYGSEESLKKAEEVMKFVHESALEASIKLAEERGTFPNYDKSVFKEKGIPLRNATLTTIAPTGTIAIITGQQGAGVEPIFAIAYERKNARAIDAEQAGKEPEEKDVFYEYSPLFRTVAEKNGWFGFKDEKNMWKAIYKNEGSVKNLEGIPGEVQRLFITAHDITGEDHIKMQAAFQKYTHNAVSKTINFRHDATKEDIAQAYLLAYQLGCKGVTVYRDGSREQQVLGTSQKKEKEYLQAKKRPDLLHGISVKKKTGCGNIFVGINDNPITEEPMEVFANIGKGGGCASAQNETIGRLISYILRIGGDPKVVANQLIGIQCHKKRGIGPKAILSCADAIGKTLAERIGVNLEEIITVEDSADFELPKLESKGEKTKHTLKEGCCPECGSPMKHTGGCRGGTCTNGLCGYSDCS